MGAALSPSRAGDFRTCPLLYRFRVVDRLPGRPSRAAARGTLVHAALERLFDLPAPERTPQAAAALLEPGWAGMLEREPQLGDLLEEGGFEDLAREATALLATWFGLEDPTRLEPAERELHVEAVLPDVSTPEGVEPGLTLRGYVDRLDEAPDGALRVVDYKTGRSPWESRERSALFQMRFYALVLWRSRGVVPRVLQLVYLGDGQVLTYEPDEHDLRAMERTVLALWSAIAEAARSGAWEPSPGAQCAWCDFRDLCPAQDGTLPPLPEDAERRALDPSWPPREDSAQSEESDLVEELLGAEDPVSG